MLSGGVKLVSGIRMNANGIKIEISEGSKYVELAVLNVYIHKGFICLKSVCICRV